LKNLEHQVAKKFKGSFDALSKMGAEYYNPQRFKPLVGNGTPLWEFKEFDHRLYCYRRPDATNVNVEVVLFNGWVKDKEGRSREEVEKVATAQSLLSEFLAEYPGGAKYE
jgi:hypothetical protein